MDFRRINYLSCIYHFKHINTCVSKKQQPNAISAPAEYDIRCRLRARRISKRIGLAEGRREGHSKLLTAVCSIMDKLGLNLDEALNALSIPETERQYFINAINNGVCE